MRFLLGIMLAIPFSAHAEDFLVRADVAEATFYNSAVEVVRPVSIDLPEGSHRVLIAMPASSNDDLLGLRAMTPDGEVLGGVSYMEAVPFVDGLFDSDEQAEARAALTSAAMALADIDRTIAEARSALSVLDMQQSFLAGVAGSGLPEGSAGSVSEMLATLRAEMAPIAAEILALERELDDLAEAHTDARQALALAEHTLAATRPLDFVQHESFFLVVPVNVAAAEEVNFDLSYISRTGRWSEETLATLSTQTSTLTFNRNTIVTQEFGDNWRDVAVTLSSHNLGERRELRSPFANSVRIREIPPPDPEQEGLGGYAEPVLEPVVIPAATGSFQSEGLNQFAELPGLHDINHLSPAVFPLAPLSFEVELSNIAVPRERYSAGHAILRASAENTSDEPLLLWSTQFFRDGTFLGSDSLSSVAPGAMIEMDFGQLRHLPVFFRNLSRNEGDAGIIRRSETQAYVYEFGVENLSDAAEDVRIIYALPFSEQEDLELELRLSIQPDETDLDGNRGVAAWDVTVNPGEVVTIRLEVDLSWPAGYELADWP